MIRPYLEQTFQIASTMDHAQHEQFIPFKSVEDQIFYKLRNRYTSEIAQLFRLEFAGRTGSWILKDSKQSGRHCSLPPNCQIGVGLMFIPVGLLQNIGDRGIMNAIRGSITAAASVHAGR
jgi:hypothetical protein